MRTKVFAAIVIFFTIGCTGNGGKEEAKRSNIFTPPTIPQEISNPKERASYTALHYWDNLDMSDTTFLKSEMMTRHFIEYIASLETIHPTEAARNVKRVMRSMKSHPRCIATFMNHADRYLYNIESPIVNEALYVPFAESIIMSSRLNDVQMARYTYRLEVARKNNPGNQANDFNYITTDGSRTTLHKTPGNMFLIYFHDPECENCKGILEMVGKNEKVATMTKEGALTPIMIYTEGYKDIWEKNKGKHPEGWIHGFDSEESIKIKRLYELRAMPSIYLLDSKKSVILKDVMPEELLTYLSTL